MDERRSREIDHGKYLAAGGAEELWGWGTAAGVRRAERRAQLIAEAAGLASGVRALEIGCGTGNFTRLFAATGATVEGNDISPELLSLARQDNPGVRFVQGAFEDLSANSGYDTVIGSSVLHHLEVERALAKCYELLRPGGRLAFAEPNMLNPQVFAERTFMRKRLKYVSPDETAFVRWSLAKAIKGAGFEQVRIVPFDWLHPSVPAALINAVQTVGRMLEFMPLLREFAGSLIISARKPVLNGRS